MRSGAFCLHLVRTPCSTHSVGGALGEHKCLPRSRSTAHTMNGTVGSVDKQSITQHIFQFWRLRMSDVVDTQVRSPRTARATTGRMRAEARFVGFVTRKIWRYGNQLRFCLAVRDRTSAAAVVKPSNVSKLAVEVPSKVLSARMAAEAKLSMEYGLGIGPSASTSVLR
jgi:hypothetical protein